MTTLNPKQFGPYLSAETAKMQNRVRSVWGGGHNNPGYGPYDHLATEPVAAEWIHKVAVYRGANSKN